MRIRLVAVGAALAVPAIVAAQGSPVHVTIELVAPALSDSTAVYVAGSLPALGNWNPGAVRLAAQGNHRWRLSITLAQPMSFEYKFTLGTWEREAADSTGAAMRNLSARVAGDTTISTTVRRWTDRPRQRVLNGQVTGTLRYHRGLKGAGLPDRDVVVWLPPGYDASRTTRYAVLYMLDGQNVFDPATSSFGTDWAVDEAADSLIRAQVIPPLIVVGVNSSSNRMAEYVPGAAGIAHMNFMLHVVKPLIDSVYRTRRDARHTYVGGSSAGGMAAFMMAWEHPDAFTRALAFSPAFQAPAGSDLTLDYVATVRATARPPKGVRFYIDIGGIGLEDRLRPGVDAMLEALKAKGYRDGRDYRIVRDPAAEHFELAWRQRFPAALAWILR